MPLPVGVEKVTVSSGQPLVLPDGTWVQGKLTFTGPDLVTIGSQDVTLGGGVTVDLVDGSFSVALIATDATGMSPTGWTYKVSARLTNAPDWTRYITLPKATPTVTLADVVVPDPVAGTFTVLVDPSTIPVAGTTAGTYTAGNDARLSNARTPTAHAATHATGGTDPVTPASIGAALAADFPYPQAAYSTPRRLPQWRQPSTIITTFQAGHGFTNNAGSTFVANDTTDFILGTQATKLVTGGLGAAANLSKLAMSNIDTTGKAIRIRLKVDDITHMVGLNFYLGSSSLASNYKWVIQGGLAGSNFVTSGDWMTVTLNWHDATVTGTPARNAITDARLQVTDDATAPVTLHANSIELIPDASTAWPNGIVSVTFDDNWQSVWDLGMPKLASYGYPASLYTIQDLIGTSGRFTMAELRALQDLHGWECGSHANTDSDHALTYTGMTAAALDTDLRALKAWGDAQGFRGAGGTAYPLGQYGKTTDGVSTSDVVRRYFDYARTTNSRTKETWPPADPYRLRAISAISGFTGGYAPSSLTTATTGDLDKAKANQSWLILVFHKIVSGAAASTTEIAQTDFNAIIDGINARGMPVLPIGDVLRYYS